MKKRLLLLPLLFLIAGCNTKQVQPKNGLFDYTYNDEVISHAKAAKIIISKSKHVMVVLDKQGNLTSKHRISLGKNNTGTKLQRGDYKTPEGTYKIVDKRTDKKYYKELLLSYPNEADKARSRKLGFNPGDGITIHAQVPWNWGGKGDDYTLEHDWTQGCVGITNKGMDTIWESVALGTKIEIRP